MVNNLVIVESPTKAKTLKKYLGADYEIMASFGHVRDLVPKGGAVDPDHDFKMHYDIISKNAKHVTAIFNKLGHVKNLILATDPDREGEAIAWHLQELILARKEFAKVNIKRVSFYEITKQAVQEAMHHPREIFMNLVDAQQARRALDYLVGFNLSPLLWRKVRRNLSAGRVQSPALRLIVEREIEIINFKTEEYWTINALLKGSDEFKAKLIEFRGEKLKQFSINNTDLAHICERELLLAAKTGLKVIDVTQATRKRYPQAPFTTSTLQQEAVRKLGFSTYKTMRVAQQLYEGIDVGDGMVGLITYMRTDSVNLSQEAIKDIRDHIVQHYDSNSLPDEARVYKTRTKNAQEAHEAIRPTTIHYTPDKVKEYLSIEQYKLYNLIWQRAVASQMIHATIQQVSANLSCGASNIFRASGAVISDLGFMQVYYENIDDEHLTNSLLPPLKVGDVIDLVKIMPEQHFTEPPPRYSEATLVKALEEYGIGRPSTYAAIISTLQHRQYVTLESKRFRPTEIGTIVNKFLTNYFATYVDYDFTAKLEDLLDDISRGEKIWRPVLKEFWQPFITQVNQVNESVRKKDVTHEALNEDCPECNHKLSIMLGKSGRFIGCTNYPQCKYTRSLIPHSAEFEELNRDCPLCAKKLVVKTGKYGKFIGCSGYPDCRHIEALIKPEDMHVQCPTCKGANLFKRKSRKGTFFYSCNNYPKCKYIVQYPPIDQSCPDCGFPILLQKVNKSGTKIICARKTCSYQTTNN